MTTPTTLVAENLKHSYGAQPVLRDVTMSVRSGEIVALMGPSGCGKSTAILILGGLIMPSSGTGVVAGSAITVPSAQTRAALRRRHLGIVFQSGELVTELTLLDNVMIAGELSGMRRRDARKRALALMERVGISDLARRFPSEVSGGQVQRAAIARALVHQPAVVLADEPTGALDSSSAAVVLGLLVELAREHRTAVLVATHDHAVAAAASRVLHMRDGSVREETSRVPAR